MRPWEPIDHPLRTPICDLLGIKWPIVQAGMGWVSRADLCAAVSNAGGLGVLGTNQLTVAEVREEIRKVKDQTDRPFGIDVLLATVAPSDDARVQRYTDTVKGFIDATLEERVPVFVSGLGDPGPLVPAMHEAGIKVMSVVGTVRAAKKVEASGVDAVVAQGHEAGGHTGRITTMVLVPAVVDAVKVPVLAAGGIVDGRGLMAGLMLGAVGIWVGTRFVAAAEAFSHPAYKEKIVEINEEGTLVTRCYTGKPARVIRNQLTDEWERRQNEILPYPLQQEQIGREAFVAARVHGDTAIGHMAASQGSGLIREVKPAAEIVADMVAEAEAILGRFTSAGVR